jgi:amino acid adenylation domain-containing protein
VVRFYAAHLAQATSDLLPITLMTISRPVITSPTASPSSVGASPQQDVAPNLGPVSREGALPLSFAQQRLWFLDQLEPGSATYNIPMALRLSGQLNVEALRLAFEELVRRHEALRTSFAVHQGQPRQLIHPPPSWTLPTVDLSALPASAQEPEVLRLASQQALLPFNLATGPLIRTTLLRLAPTEHVLLLCMHHAVSDGGSMGLLTRELAAFYEGFCSQRPASLPHLPIQYADFAAWQRQWLQGEVLERQLTYWRQKLAGAPPALELPTDKPRPPIQSFRGSSLPVQLPKALSESLKALAQKEGATPFMLLLAAWQLLLSRYSGQQDVCIGSPIAGRTRSETEGLIGFFVNTLVLRSRLASSDSFRQLLAQVRSSTLEAYEHQHLPFEKLVEALQPQRDLSRSPLFQAMFVLQDAPEQALSVQGLSLRPLDIPSSTAMFELTLSLSGSPEGFTGSLEFNTDLFERDTASRLAANFSTLLHSLCDNPDQSLSELSVLSAQERQRLLLDWNATQAPFDNSCIQQLFAQQVARTPDAIALAFGDTQLTYRQLHLRSNQLAHRLQSLGVGPDVRVGLSLSRSVELIVGMLAILKAGGTYVPLDPTYPRDRLAYMLQDSGAPVLLTQQHLANALPHDGVKVLCVDSDASLDKESPLEPTSACTPLNTAYAIYTSGSTGKPKGVLVIHRTVANFFAAMDLRLEQPADHKVWLAVTSVSFDISVLELLWTLCRGFKVVLQSDTFDSGWLPQQVQRHRVTHLQCTPSLAQALLLEPQSAEALKSLRQMLVGGEALPPSLARQLRDRVPSLLNMYGPTETTIWSSSHPVHQAEGPIPLGTPIANTQLYVLDSSLRPVPTGVAGELFIAGDGVVRGYLNRPDLTADRFVPDPFSSSPGARMYRTGDMARWRADGTVDFLGRGDNQVKLRGFRIELGEIESALNQHASVRSSVVVVREDVPGDKRLVAYLIAKQGHSIDSAELRLAVKQRLPEYMVPSLFVALEAFPLTPNGKVDRKALPVPEGDQSRREDTHAAPRTPLEETVASVFREVLGHNAVGVNDDFFELGGHSLLATQVVSRLRARLEVDLSVRTMFDARTVATLAQRIETLQASPAQQKAASIPRLSRETREFPLSFAQQRLWFLEELEPGRASYNIPYSLELRGELETESLRRTFQELVRRHEPLRTVFVSRQGEPVQRILPAPESWPLPLTDLSGLEPAAREAELRRLVSEEAARPFNLTAGPMLRSSLVRLGAREHVLLLTMHHIASDGWSLGVLVREVEALYEAFRTGRSAGLPELEVQYADFSQWQRQWLSGEVLEEQLTYWKKRLKGASDLELPTDRPRPPVRSQRGAGYTFTLPARLVPALEQVGREQGATLFMVLLAAYKVLLFRYSGQGDLTVGTPIASRTRPELEPLIGFFVNTLVVRTDLSDEPGFRELLSRVKEAALGAFSHQDVPFERLVEALGVPRDLSRTPLFQAMFVLHNEPVPAVAISGVESRLLMTDSGTSKFDLTLALTAHDGQLEGHFEYSLDLFEPSTIERMAGHLRTLLESIAKDTRQRISRLPLLTEAERRQLLEQWNQTRVAPEADTCVHHLFQAQVARTPEAIAISFRDSRLTYRELDNRANQLARHLQSLGVKPAAMVGLCVERSLDMIVGIFGILKAGATYVPLDPTYPPQRLGFMLRDSEASVVLTQEKLLSALPPHTLPTVCLDTAWAQISRLPTHEVTAEVTPNDLAYVIYTSGSTGQPKGSLLTHRGLCNTALAVAKAERLGPGSKVLQFAAIAFDASLWDSIPPLVSGAQLCLAPREELRPGDPLQATLEREAITVMALPPSVQVQLDPSRLPAMKTVVSGGEACPPEVIRMWQPGRKFINAYGPTEVTICATMHEDPSPERVTIGRALPNTQVYILRGLEPVPVGVPGELCLSGHGLARGYLARAGLTAEKFIPHPFSSTPGARLYRTGDLVRWLPDGTIDFLGRIDDQVKLRGFRIELGEIETALADHPAVREAAVLLREDSPGDKRLVAYVVPEQGQKIDVAELRAFLKPRLPDYMLPAAFVVMEAFSLTYTGKVDRKALPAPQKAQVERAPFVAPRNPTEERLAGIWAQVLRVDPVGIHDDFFALGGHSLLATQVISRVRGTFHIELPLRVLFEAPSVSELARRVDAAQANASRDLEPALTPVPREGVLPLSFAQQRLWFLDQLEPGAVTYNIPTALRLSGQLNVDALRRSFEELVRRHEALRTSFAVHQGQPRQLIHPAPSWTLPAVDLTALPASAQEPEVLRLASQQTLLPFNLATGPLIRTTLLRLAPTEHVLLLCMHHIIADGWSMGVLTRELASLYEAFSSQRSPSLPPLPIQYADFAAWQRQWLQGEVLERQLTYWRQKLAGAPPALELPTDKPRPPIQSFRGSSLPVQLPKALSESLKALAQKEGATPFMLLLAAWQLLLSRYSGQQDVCIGSPIAGRTRSETEGLIGFFVNTLVLRSRLASSDSFRQLLAQVRSSTLEAYEHQHLPFEKLVEALQPQRDLSRSPLFQAMFVLQNAPEELLSLQGLALRPLDLPSSSAMFELTLFLSDSPEGFTGLLEFNTDLFERDTASRLAANFSTLLHSLCDNPDLLLTDAPLLSSQERQRLLAEFNATQAPFTDSRIQQFFVQQVARTPDAIALAFGDTQLTYRQLHLRSNQLAHHLQSLGVGPDVRVGLSLSRSLELVIGMLGILKAGGTYVPLDPTYPRDRLTYMLQDSGARVLLTQQHLADALPHDGVTVLCLDSDASLSSENSLEPTSACAPDNTAYVIYTSGSTGKPKGVLVPHRTVANLFAAMDQRLEQPADHKVWLTISSVSFDISVVELLWTLCRGFKVVLQPDLLDSGWLPAQIRRHNVTHLQCTPSLVRALLQEPQSAEAFKLLRQVILGGEALPPELARQLLASVPSLINGYGPTETTIYSSTHDVRDAGGPIPIGTPLANTQFYILDSSLRPVPIGVTGELFIAGDGVVRGYLNRPDLTADRFIPDCFSAQPGARMYRTGDMARWRSDGTVDFLGRGDHQVKLRGFRIELGEVEAALSQHPSVRTAVVVVREDVPGDKRMVAYLLAKPGHSIDASELRVALKQRLPEYMVPSLFVALEAFPLTPSGKVDRKALPKPDGTLSTSAAAFVAPRDQLELMLTKLWEELLRVQPIGVTQSFFEVGGHSLLAVSLMAQLESRLGQRLPLSTLFTHPTIEGLAALLRQQKGATEWTPLVPIQPQGSRRPLFCVHPVGGTTLCYAPLARQLGADQPLYGLEARGLDGSQPITTIETMAEAYLQAVRKVQPEGPYLLGGWSLGGVVAFEMARQLTQAGQQVELVAMFDSWLLASSLSSKPAPTDDIELLIGFAVDLASAQGKQLHLSREQLERLEPGARLPFVLEQARGSGELLPGVGTAELRAYFNVYRANVQALLRYVPGSGHSLPLAFFWATQSGSASPAASAPDVERGWAGVTRQPPRLHGVAGDHYSILLGPGLEQLVSQLRPLLQAPPKAAAQGAPL